MKYIVKNIRDSDKENAQQFELILNNKTALYNDISEVIKERVDNFELTIDEQIKQERKTIRVAIVGYDVIHRPYEIKEDIREAIGLESICDSKQQHVKDLLIEQMNFKNQFEILDRHKFEHIEVFAKKENHPYGWYRKFEKKRF